LSFLDGRVFDGYDRDGEPISDAQAVELLSLPLEDRLIAQDHVGDFLVTTVHTVVNHEPPDRTPRVFETTIYPLADTDAFREHTGHQRAARVAHTRAVSFARELAEAGGIVSTPTTTTPERKRDVHNNSGRYNHTG
jgi:hypothetical protein